MSATIVGNSAKREGACSIRSAKGIPILDQTYYFLVVCTAKDEPYTSVINASGLPTVGETLTADGYAICKAKSATRRTDNAFYWDVQCDFSSEVDESSSGSTTPTPSDPTTWVPVYETKHEKIQEIVTEDLDGTAVANSAGQPFPQGLVVTRRIPVWEFYQIEPPISDEEIIDRSEVINEGVFRGREEETCLLTVLSSTVGYYYGARRRLTQYSLKYNFKKWTHKRLDIGTIYLSGTDRMPYLDDGTPPRVINGGLDGSGAKVTAGDPPFVLEFDIIRKIPFTFLRV